MATTKQLIELNKNNGQDFEWYPTTQAMIDCVDYQILQNLGDYDRTHKAYSVLDCGAGDGRVLHALAHGGSRFAVEKSTVLLEALDREIFIAGTDFFTSTLIDKKVDIVFSNPPYSEFQQWAEKIIIEANSKFVFLVLPERWNNSRAIAGALKTRGVKANVIGRFDFLRADRAARAKVNIIMIDLRYQGGRYCCDDLKTDPFDIWFGRQFQLKGTPKKESEEAERASLKSNLEKAVVNGSGLIPALVELYNHEMAHLQENFAAVSRLDPDILKELDVNVKGLKAALKQKIKGLKNKYWKEFFSNYEPITSRLTHGSRQNMLNRLHEHTSVDFNEGNIYAITIWAIKNANKYYDNQLVGLVERMISEANIKLYQSNQRTFGREEWRYCRRPENLSRFALELRVILSNFGGIQEDQYNFRYHNGLHERAHEFINDIITVAGNLGYTCNDNSRWHEWESRKKIEFVGNKGTLMQVTAFKNGNLHIKFNQNLIKTLNVEFGRLKGWLKNAQQAADELDIPPVEALQYFNKNKQLAADQFPLLLAA